MAATIHQRLLHIQDEFFEVVVANDSQAMAAFTEKWAQLISDLEVSQSEGAVDAELAALGSAVVDAITTIAGDVLLPLSETADVVRDELSHMLNERLSLEDKPAPTPTIPRTTSSAQRRRRASPSIQPDGSIPAFIPLAYSWLKQHLSQPYPPPMVVTNIALQASDLSPHLPPVSEDHVRDWFKSARRKMGWNVALNKHFNKSRSDMIRAARKYFSVQQSGAQKDEDPLPQGLVSVFVQIEESAKEMYAEKFVPSALVCTIGSTFRTWTPELEAQARRERAQVAYPSPSPEPDSPSYSLKRAFTEDYDDEEYERFFKRRRTDQVLPTPPDSPRSSPAPTSRKRRLSESDSESAPKRQCIRTASLPIVDIAAETSLEFLASYFENTKEEPPLTDPFLSLDMKLFQACHYEASTVAGSSTASPSDSVRSLSPVDSLDAAESFVNNAAFSFDVDQFLKTNVHLPVSDSLLFEPQVVDPSGDYLAFETYITPQSLSDLSVLSLESTTLSVC